MSYIVYARPENCNACGASVEPWLHNVQDQVYGVNGQWDIYRCCNRACATAYLDAKLEPNELSGFYDTYSTHLPPVLEVSGVKLIFRQAVEWMLHRKLGYDKPNASLISYMLASILLVVPFFRATALSRAFWLPFKPDGKLVEIGFGNAQSLMQLRKLGWQVSGVEFDSVCVKDAKKLGFDVGQGNFESQGYVDASLDAVVASHVIEHVPEPGRLMSSIYEKLAPGGRMVLVTPNALSWGAAIFKASWRGLEVPRHLTIQTPNSLLWHARKAGFQKVRVFGTPLGGGILHQSMQISLGLKCGPANPLVRFFWVAIANMIHIVRPQLSDEVVLICQK